MFLERSVLMGVFAMAAVVVVSNVLVQHLLGSYLTWGALTYPIAFLVTDVINRNHGPEKAGAVIVAGFVAGLLCSLVASQLAGAEGQPLTTLRIAVASGSAFLIAQLTDVAVFNRVTGGGWYRAPFISSLVGSALDTLLFFSIAFAGLFMFIDPADPNGWARELSPLLGVGPTLPLWVSLAVADFSVKLALAVLALVPFRLLTFRLM